MSNFICIAFGPAEDVARNGWWNRKQRFDTKEQATQCGRDLLSAPGTFGYVVIEEIRDWWMIVDELGAPSHAVSVGCHHHSYFVQPAPQFTLV